MGGEDILTRRFARDLSNWRGKESRAAGALPSALRVLDGSTNASTACVNRSPPTFPAEIFCSYLCALCEL
jgi:hypothetical protein